MTETNSQRVILACRHKPRESQSDLDLRIGELTGLCEAAGGEVVQTFTQSRADVDRSTYLGAGKIADIGAEVAAMEANLVVFDSELTPGQVRSLEHRLGCRLLDRTQLILDIFAQRAQSSEGRLQVEIAQLQYLLPRLTGRGAELSRLGGGIGTRGPGETKLETDRRRIRQRIDHLRERLRQVTQRRSTQRAMRSRSVPVVALVGYTNAGKSTLLQRWIADRGGKATALGNSRLFDTLDPLARHVRTSSGGDLVVLDTVGFVQDLPHLLVNAFRATLEEVLQADLIVHVLDGNLQSSFRAETTYGVLADIGALDKPVVTFYNKMDLSADSPPPDLRALVTLYGSAVTGSGMEALYTEVERRLQLDPVHVLVEGTTADGVWDRVRHLGKVIAVEESGERLLITVEMDREHAYRLDRTGVDVASVRIVDVEPEVKA